jgi:hypothetical protein
LPRVDALAFSVVVSKSSFSTPATRTDPHPIRDFFIADLIDYAPKDHPDMMERPFFAIAKRKRLRPIEYESADGSVWIKVTGHPEHGMATINCRNYEYVQFCADSQRIRDTSNFVVVGDGY